MSEGNVFILEKKTLFRFQNTNTLMMGSGWTSGHSHRLRWPCPFPDHDR